MQLKITKFGKYQLIKKIARGGMAEIFLGCTGSIKHAHKFITVKRMLSVQRHDVEFKNMFLNEGKIAVNLNHSNIASIYEFGIEQGQYFICMEYIPGRNIRQMLNKLGKKRSKLEIKHIAHIIKYACLGLDYTHNYTDKLTGKVMNIIHRDISPQNIMISFDGEIKLIDFGIAKIDDSEATKVGVLKGKLEYMSPEQVQGKTMDRQTDIFSMGSILWELLAGQKLFTASTDMKIIKKIKACRIPDLKKIDSSIPTEMVHITNKALHPDKNMRYKTIADMANDLASFLNRKHPHFHQTHFSDFIKDIYSEEIVQERKSLIHYADFINKGTTLTRFSSAPISENEKSTFMNYDLSSSNGSNQSIFTGLSESRENRSLLSDIETNFLTNSGSVTGSNTYSDTNKIARQEKQESKKSVQDEENKI